VDDRATSEFASLEEALLLASESLDDVSPLEPPHAANAANTTHSAARQRGFVGILVAVGR